MKHKQDKRERKHDKRERKIAPKSDREIKALEAQPQKESEWWL